MMNTRYITFILRLRLEERDPQGAAGDSLHGSLQQVGLQEIHYFDSAKKFQIALQKVADRVTLKEMNYGKSDE